MGGEVLEGDEAGLPDGYEVAETLDEECDGEEGEDGGGGVEGAGFGLILG